MPAKKDIYLGVKRVLDFFCAVFFLFLLAPLMVLIGLTILAGDGKPILFRQVRPGLREKSFTVLKFRTMETPLKNSSNGQKPDVITDVGRILRRFSLDELPQLWNVMRGDMSFIGPRPLLVEYLPLYDSRQSTRHEVRPGMTGLAQVSGRNALTWDQKFELDVQYVQSVSLWYDIKILFQSLSVVVSSKGVTPPVAELMAPFTGSSAHHQTQLDLGS